MKVVMFTFINVNNVTIEIEFDFSINASLQKKF